MHRLGERFPSVQDASMSRRAKVWIMSLSICVLLLVVIVSQLLWLGNIGWRTIKQLSRCNCVVSKFSCKSS